LDPACVWPLRSDHTNAAEHPRCGRSSRFETHDYKRHGTLTFFAALDYLEGKLISRTEQRHTHVEWLRILK
jgi:hypothetical protein